RKFNNSTNTINITHWTIQTNSHNSNLYPIPETICMPCTGCSHNTNRISDHCTFDISATLSTQFNGRKCYYHPPNKLKIYSNFLALLHSIAVHNTQHTPPTPILPIPNNPTHEIFISN